MMKHAVLAGALQLVPLVTQKAELIRSLIPWKCSLQRSLQNKDVLASGLHLSGPNNVGPFKV